MLAMLSPGHSILMAVWICLMDFLSHFCYIHSPLTPRRPGTDGLPLYSWVPPEISSLQGVFFFLLPVEGFASHAAGWGFFFPLGSFLISCVFSLGVLGQVLVKIVCKWLYCNVCPFFPSVTPRCVFVAVFCEKRATQIELNWNAYAGLCVYCGCSTQCSDSRPRAVLCVPSPICTPCII